ncbi:MAG: PSP1 domain-containing protein [Bacteriovoracaceae bacterium]
MNDTNTSAQATPAEDEHNNSENSRTITHEDGTVEAKPEPQEHQEHQEKNKRFNEGDPLTFVRVRFPGNAKSFPFLLGKKNFRYGQKVVAMSDRGMAVGYINSFPYEKAYQENMGQLKTIAKIATQEDLDLESELIEKERKAEVLCNKLIDDHKLNMNITHVQYIQYGKKAVFYFTAPERVDFRNLVKDLVKDLKMRIELRQISVRDRSAALGAVGACGLQTCCSSFLGRYGHVSMKLAKNQNLALIPSKINGVCGQLKCCIKYEDDVYSEKRKKLPGEGKIVKLANGDIGKVYRLHLLIEQFEMLTDRGVRKRYAKNQFVDGVRLPKDYKYPQKFDHVTDETSTVIGLSDEDQKLAKKFAQYHNNQDIDNDQDEEVIETDYDDASAEEVKAKDERPPSKETPKKDQKSQPRSKDDSKKRNNNRRNRNRNRNKKSAKPKQTKD